MFPFNKNAHTLNTHPKLHHNEVTKTNADCSRIYSLLLGKTYLVLIQSFIWFQIVKILLFCDIKLKVQHSVI